MKLRGFTRLAAAAAATVLLVGGFASPARAEGDLGDILEGLKFPGPVLTIDDLVLAATAPTQGCAKIDTGSAVVGKDGWLFNQPRGEYEDLAYVFIYLKPDPKTVDDIVMLLLDGDGVLSVDLGDPTPQELVKSLNSDAAAAKAAAKVSAKSAKAAAADDWGFPTVPGPAGVGGVLGDGDSWIQTPAGWSLAFGAALTNPLLETGSFDLVRACPAAAKPSASASPSPSKSAAPGGSELPVTGTNIWVLTGGGVALVAVGAVLFMAYRRRQSVKFVA